MSLVMSIGNLNFVNPWLRNPVLVLKLILKNARKGG